MSRAFVKELDGDEITYDLLERTVSPLPNYVTDEGMRQLHKKTDYCAIERKRFLQDEEDFSAKLYLVKLERDLRYFQKRLEQAIPVNPEEQDAGQIRFGMHVEVQEGEEIRCFRIVSEDEALQGEDFVSWVSPLARAVLGASLGDKVLWKKPGGNVGLKILSFGYSNSVGTAEE